MLTGLRAREGGGGGLRTDSITEMESKRKRFRTHLPALLVPLDAFCLRGLFDDPRNVSVLRNAAHLGHVFVPVLRDGHDRDGKASQRMKNEKLNR